MERPTLIVSLFTVLCAAASPARAEEAVYGPAAPPGVQGKLYQVSRRWEVGVAFGAALNTSMVDQYGGILSISYHPNEWVDAGVDLLANRTRFTGLSGQIRDKLPSRTNPGTGQPNTGDEIAGADQMRGGALVMGRIAPIYGKLNLAAELPVHFQVFLLGGAGAAAFKHESVNLCASPGDGPCAPGDYQTTTSLKPVGEAGGGLRFYLGQRYSLRTEVRAFLYPASVLRGADLTQPGTGTSARYLGLITTVGLGASALF
ncbi:MAG: outer membrane beta-barrel domain-containing protein [Myxococcales bacterium]